MPTRNQVITGLVHFSMALFVAAAILKLTDLHGFAYSLASWRLLPKQFVPLLVIFVPSFELGVALIWFVLGPRALAVLVAVIALSAASLAYVSHGIALGVWPTCGCLGALAREHQWMDSSFAVLVRNGFLLSSFIAWWFFCRHPRSTAPRLDVAPSSRTTPVEARAFTLIEILVVIAVIGGALAVAIPMLRTTKAQARSAVTLSDLRTHTTAFSQYCSDFRGTFPYLTDPTATWSTLVSTEVSLKIRYFDLFARWNIGMADRYYGISPRSACFVPQHPGEGYVTPYWYSATFLADPLFWTTAGRVGPKQWRSISEADVSNPSKKGLFVFATTLRGQPEAGLTNGGDPADAVETGWTDGSASVVKRPMFLPAYPRGEGEWPGTSFQIGWPVMHTFGGVAGGDVR